MATKNYCLSSEDGFSNTFGSNNSSSQASQYSNLNLNANCKISKIDSVCSSSVSNERRSAITKLPDQFYDNNYQNTSSNDTSSWLKSNQTSYSNLSTYHNSREDVQNYKPKMKYSNSSNSSNNSTLSLHIAAYENSVEAAAADRNEDKDDQSDGETDDKKAKKWIIGRAYDSFKDLFTGLTSRNYKHDETSTPETMKFRRSQKLFDPNKSENEKQVSTKDKIGNSLNTFATRQAMGQVALLGELFDGHKDVFCEYSLFKNIDSSIVNDFINASDIEDKSAEFIFNDSINSTFKKFGVEGDLKLSVLSGMIKEGSERKYLTSPATEDGTETIASAVFQLITKYESINVNSLINFISSEAIEKFPFATHFITGIDWGARIIVDLIYKHQNDDTPESINQKLKLAFGQLEKSFIGVETNSQGNCFENLRLHFHIEALPDFDPKSFAEAITFMKDLPSLIKEHGQIMPISYSMIPIVFYTENLKNSDIRNRIVSGVDEKIVEEVVEIFYGIAKSFQMLNFFVDNNYCLENGVNQMVDEKLQKLKAAVNELQKDLQKAVILVRYGRKAPDAIIKVFQSYLSSDLIPEAITSFCHQFPSSQQKIGFIQNLVKNGVIYVGKETSMEAERKKLNLDECYEYYCDWSNEKDRDENSCTFLSLLSDETKMAFIDLQVNPLARNASVFPDGNRICQFLNGRYIDTDCLQKWRLDQSKSWVKCMERKHFSGDKPKKRIDVKLPCPQSFKDGSCSATKIEWYCSECDQKLQYDFKQHFYCRCGIAPVGAYQFRCSDPKHGDSFLTYEENQLTALIDDIRPNKEINILLLGETGVGKSTWINSFANYLTSSTLAEAEKANPISLIPSQFVSTKLVNGKFHKITVNTGESKNENFKDGESATQEPQSHVFTVGDKTLRIIDTPGIGDTRGTVTDKENFASILQFISQFDEIHGICVLLKPNNSRLTLVFKYCINELLAHLHKSAAKNIAFCFTNARNTFYRPGDTWPILERYTDELYDSQKVRIELNHETIYCLDNEAFRFLCLLNNGGGEFTNDERANFDKSWEISVKETQRLLNHFENDVQPHVVSETVSLNEARNIILTAAKPLADITRTIQLNIKSINRHLIEIQQADAYELKLEGKLKIKHIGIKVEPLGYPRTVCRSIGCTDTKRLPNTEADTVVYRTICHEHCYLQNVAPEIAPNPDLQRCKAMGGTMFCQECGCSWDTHLHITFNQEEAEVEIEDENIRFSIDQNKSAKEVQQDAIKVLEQRIEGYKKAQTDIDQILAKYASFLKKNAIITYNDTIEDYLKLNIRDEKEQRNPNQELLRKMEEQLAQYREEKRILDSRLASGEEEHVKPGDIKVLQRQLENLPLVGKDFKMLFDAHVRGAQSNLQLGEQYYDPYYHTNIQKPLHQIKRNNPQQNNFVQSFAQAASKSFDGFFNYLLK